MEYTLDVDMSIKILRVHHPKHQTLEYDMFYLFNKSKDLSTPGLIGPINDYLATLPDNVVEEYIGILETIKEKEDTMYFSSPNFVKDLENYIAHCTKLLDYEGFKQFMYTISDRIKLPDGLVDEFEYDQDMNVTRNKTYLKREYIDLISMFMFIRMLIPLYIDYYNRLQVQVKLPLFRLFRVFVKSDLYHCPEMEKLRLYIEVNSETQREKSNADSLIVDSGLSSEDNTDNLISYIIFNKLVDKDFFLKADNIISFIYQTIRFRTNSDGATGISSKGTSARSSDSRDKMSYFEDYRKTSDIPLGTVVEIQHALSDLDRLIAALDCPEFDMSLLEKEMENIGALMEANIDSIQITLLGWLLSDMVNPRGLFYIDHRRLVELLIIGKIALLSKGHDLIATLFTSVKVDGSAYTGNAIRHSIDRDIISRLANGPYRHISTGNTQIYLIVELIQRTSDRISSNVWKPLNPPLSMKENINSEGYLVIPGNINNQIAEYIEEVTKVVTE